MHVRDNLSGIHPDGAYKNEQVFYYVYGNDGGGTPFRQEHSYFTNTGFSVKKHPDTSSSREGTVRRAKGYKRVIASVITRQPGTYVETSPWDQFKAIYERFPDVELEPADHPQGGEIWNNLVARAETNVLNKLKGGKQLQLGADLGESRKTLDMIAKPSIQVLEAFRAAKGGKWGKIPSILGMSKRDIRTGYAPANRWLEYQYGWLPLMGSIDDGMNALKEGFHDTKLLNFFSTKSTAKETLDLEKMENDCIKRYTYEYLVKCGIVYKISNQTISNVSSAGLLNPLSIAWELVPFSFVLDWFIPVGNVLSALSATAGLEFVDGYRSEVLKKTLSSRIDTSRDFGTLHKRYTSGGHHETQSLEFNRVVYSNFPRPQFHTAANPFSTKHVANALALLRQLI